MSRALPRLLLSATSLLALVALVLFIAMLRGSRSTPAAPKENPVIVQPLVLERGQRGSFELSLSTEIHTGAAEPGRQEWIAQIDLQVLDATSDEPGSALAGLKLRDVEFRENGRRDPLRESALTAPFTVRWTHGAVTATEFPDGLDGQVRRQLESIVRAFQCTLPPDANPVLAVEEDGLGRYRAQYHWTAPGDLERKKLAYLGATDGAEAAPHEVELLISEASFTMEPQGPWWQQARVDENLRILSLGQRVARIAQHWKLVLRHKSFDSRTLAAADWLAQNGDAVAHAVNLEREGGGPVVRAALRAEDRRAFEQALSEFVGLERVDVGALHWLAARLIEFPELAADVDSALRSGELAASIASGLCHALEQGGNADCQQVLGRLAGEVGLADDLRRSAVVALGGVAEPTAEAEHVLHELARGMDPTLATMSQLALGSLAQHLRDSDPGRYSALRSWMVDQIARAHHADGAVVSLRAAANSKDPSLADSVLTRLGDESPAVRAAAAEAAAALGGGRVAAQLELALRDEGDARVRAALAQSLAATGDALRACTVCAERIESEGDPTARGAMARVLADHLDSYPAGRAVLHRMLETERSAEIIAHVAGRLHRSSASVSR